MKAAGDENIFLINSRARLDLGVIAGQCHTWAGLAPWAGDHSRGRLSRTLEPSRWPLWMSSGSWGQVSSLNTSFPHDQVGHLRGQCAGNLLERNLLERKISGKKSQ